MTGWLTKEVFFDRQAERGDALTYDDITLRFMASDVADTEVSLDTRFSTSVQLKNPFVSAAMDTVTDSDMAIAMARLGGIGIIHNAMDLGAQRKEVRKVKNAQNGFIEDPVSYHIDTPLEKILDDRPGHDSDFWSYLVYDSGKKLVGMLNEDDFLFAEDHSISAGEAMKPLEALEWEKIGTTKEEAYRKMLEEKVTKLPIRNEDGTIGGLYTFSDVSRIIRGNPGNITMDENGQLCVGAAVGTRSEDALLRTEAMLRYGLDVVVIDTSTGDMKYAIDTLRELKAAHPGLDVVIGNISDADSVRKLVEAGADGIKVGQGPGAICTTRRELGGGLPQATAVFECFRAMEELSPTKRVPICADGGIVYRGDVSKALALGADTVMMGGFLAGTEESASKPRILNDGTKVASYRGMGSEGAMRDGNDARGYGSGKEIPPPQGVEGFVAYKGPLEFVIGALATQLRKSMATCNAATIREHQQKTRVRRITAAGLREAHAHDIAISDMTLAA